MNSCHALSRKIFFKNEKNEDILDDETASHDRTHVFEQSTIFCKRVLKVFFDIRELQNGMHLVYWQALENEPFRTKFEVDE